MKFKWLWMFPGIGVLLLVIAVGMQLYRLSDQAQMSHTRGKIIDVEKGCPSLLFSDASEQVHRYRSNTCTNPPAFAVGEWVNLYYDPQNPSDARIDSFSQNWVGSLIVGGIGLVFLLIGIAIVLPPLIGRLRGASLLATGTPVQAEVVDVELNEGLSINGRNPYRIVAQWLNPQTNKLHVFRSANLWFDPGPYISESLVTVMIDPPNPKRYSMDTRFLPELAD